MLAERDDERTGLVPDAKFSNRPTRGRARFSDFDLGQLQVRPDGGGHRVEERGHLGPQHEIRHHLPGRRIRKDNAVGPREHELSLGIGVRRASDDREIRPRSTRRENDVEVGDIGVGRGDQPASALDTGALQVVVAGRVAGHEQIAPRFRRRDRRIALVEHDVRDVGLPELFGDAAAHTAVAADDVVVAQLVDRLPPPPFDERARQHASRHRLDDNGTGVRDNRQPRDQEDDRQRARRVVGRNRVEARERDRDHRPVEGLKRRLRRMRRKPTVPATHVSTIAVIRKVA